MLVRRRDRDTRHPLQRPEQCAIQIVRPDLVRSRRDDLGALSVLPDERRRPVALLITWRSPDLFTGLGIQREQIRILIVVVHKIEPVAIQHRRCGGPPTESSRLRLDGVLPDFLTIKVKAKHADIAEVGIDSLSIRDRRLRGIAALQVNWSLWPPFMDLPLPTNFASLQVETVDLPLMHGIWRLRSIAAEIESLLRLFGLTRIDDRRQEDAVAPNNRRRPASPRNVRLPSHVLRCRPTVGKVVGTRNATRIRPTELRPVRLCNRLRTTCDDHQTANRGTNTCHGFVSSLCRIILIVIGWGSSTVTTSVSSFAR